MSKLKMTTPYSNLTARKSNASKDYYMLSEFIDNSIGSWNKTTKKTKLEIKIVIDNPRKRIIIDDNASGMSSKELGDSIRLNIEKSGNVLNMFGVGLKNAAFWFGQDLIIETNNGKSSHKTEILTSKIKDLSKTIEWEVLDFDKKNQGTTVYVNNTYEEREISKKQFEKSLQILSHKYMKYLENNVEIKFFYFKDIKSKQRIESLKSTRFQAQVIPIQIKNEIIDAINNSYEEKSIKYLKNIKEDAIEKIKNNEPLEFKYVLKHKIKNDIHEFAFVIGIQPSKLGKRNSNFKEFYGLTTFQNDRAINIPPENPISFGEYVRTNIKRVYGYVELGDVFKPDNNKQEFNFGVHKEIFEKFILDIGNDIIGLADAISNVFSSEEKVKSGNRIDSVKKLQDATTSKINPQIIINSTGAKINNVILEKNSGEKYNLTIVEVSVDNINDQNYFINAKSINGSSYDFEIFFNINHPIWKPLTQSEVVNQIDNKTVIYPLIAIIGLCSIGIKGKIFGNILEKENIDVIEALNLVSGVIIK